MAESIHFRGEIKWFSPGSTKGRFASVKDALKAHIRYITRLGECVVSWNLDWAKWSNEVDRALAQRRDAKVACKFVIALPNTLTPQQGVELLKEFFTSEEIFHVRRRKSGRVSVRLAEEDVGIAVHDSTGVISLQRNLHAHVIVTARPSSGIGTININKAGMRAFHHRWVSFLERKGFKVKTGQNKLPHLGPQRLRSSKNALELLAGARMVYEAVELERSAEQAEQKYLRALERFVQKAEEQTLDDLILEELSKAPAPGPTPMRTRRKHRRRKSILDFEKEPEREVEAWESENLYRS